MITLDLSILNQKGTPMFYSDITANRPAAGIVGRIFIATDSPYGLFRDTGSAWEQVAGSGGGGGNTIYTANDTLTSNRIVSDGGFGLSFTSTTYIGIATIGSGSGKLIVGSSSADNGIQVFGANSPSIRVDNAQSGATQRFAIGLSTATNNFIQGSASGDVCITTASASPILFGMWQTINASEVMRISTASNLLLGSPTDTGEKFQNTGTSRLSGNVLINTINAAIQNILQYVPSNTSGEVRGQLIFQSPDQTFVNGGDAWQWRIATIGAAGGSTNFSSNLQFGRTLRSGSLAAAMTISANLNVGIGTETPAQQLHLFKTSGTATIALQTGTAFGYVYNDGTNIILGSNEGAVTGYKLLVNRLAPDNSLLIASTGNVLINTTSDSGNKLRLNGSFRIDGQSSATAGGSSGLHLIINLDGTNYKIALLNV